MLVRMNFILLSGHLQHDLARHALIVKTPAPLTGSLSVEDQFATIFGYCFSGCFAQVKHAIGLLDSDAAIPRNQALNWMLAAAGE
ncbi:hypothetical protein [Lacipirellula limnantheis]|uniref:Uncharacterized protein n=1 Tax=Lacipirellula limnantheis TaxID=2528024 RepID=A0A517U4Y6_9BACT|nr:hypothetical protein [Lacipirellula limnantheis]QDT75630.1 hypothetical protein I41_48700 [Lacipirellula limnantheis]